MRPDHAGVFETSLLHALRPELVHLERLGDGPGTDDDTWDPRDREHPLWGIFGPNPRQLSEPAAMALLEATVAALQEQSHAALRATAEGSGS